MAETFNKKEREKKKALRKKEKLSKKEARKDNPSEGGWESMIAYVDENGVIQDTPPDPTAKKKISAESIELGVPKREKEDIDPIMEGTINFFDGSKGYGFIKGADGEMVFVHFSNITGTPDIGKKVTFEKEKGPRGWTAVRVKVI